MNYRLTAPVSSNCAIALPASKSISNRLLLIRTLCAKPFRIFNLAECDDTIAMQRALEAADSTIDVGGAGTAMRFLTAYYATRPGHTVTLKGDERMSQRPIAPLVDALRQLGADIEYIGNDGFPPLRITGKQLAGNQCISIPGNVSSQFISALLMIAPTTGGLSIEITGAITSRPYIDMTLSLMSEYGIDATWHDSVIQVPAGEYLPHDYAVEADWSAAAFWFALQALLPQSHIVLNGLMQNSLQGDARVAEIFASMGINTTWNGDELSLDCSRVAQCCCSTFADLNGTPDLAPTLVVALCLLGRPFRITGLGTLRVKESDRLEVLRSELRKLGYSLQIEGNEALQWHFETVEPQTTPAINPHTDHRMAMAFALAAVKFPGIVINDAQVVNKSYPLFWQHLEQVGFTITSQP